MLVSLVVSRSCSHLSVTGSGGTPIYGLPGMESAADLPAMLDKFAGQYALFQVSSLAQQTSLLRQAAIHNVLFQVENLSAHNTVQSA